MDKSGPLPQKYTPPRRRGDSSKDHRSKSSFGKLSLPIVGGLVRRWGCEAALQGARLRLARSYLVGSQAQAGGAAFGDSADAFGAGFDPSREADVAAAGAPTLGGVPAGQRG